jgi:ankyrin repeat protein
MHIYESTLRHSYLYQTTLNAHYWETCSLTLFHLITLFSRYIILVADENSLMDARAIQISAPPSLVSCIDVVDRATAPYPNDKQSGAIVSFDFKCPPSLLLGQSEHETTFNLKFMIQFKGKNKKPIEIEEVTASHFNLNNNIAELLSDSTTNAIFRIIETNEKGKAVAELRPLDGLDIDNDQNLRITLLLGVYPSSIDVFVSLSAVDGTRKLRSAVIGTARQYIGSSPSQTRLRDLLCWTAAFGHVKAFQAYLSQMPHGIDTEDSFGMTPFSWAALGGQAPVVRLALQQAGSVGARRSTAKGPAPLEAAAHSQNEDIFELFLKWLKYLESPVAIDTAFDPNEIPEQGYSLIDDDIEREIHSAIRNRQTFTTQKLVEILYKSQSKHGRKSWLASRIVEAAEKGDLYLVQALRSCGAEVNCENDNSVTPLLGAINNKQTKVAEYLILQGAEDDEDSSALKRAVKTSQHSTIRALLQVKIQMKGELKETLIGMASKRQDSTTLMLLQLEKGIEELATPKDLCPEVDELFYATVVDFTENRRPEFTELTVNELMQPQKDLFDLEESSFKWFHLPANNVCGIALCPDSC